MAKFAPMAAMAAFNYGASARPICRMISGLSKLPCKSIPHRQRLQRVARVHSSSRLLQSQDHPGVSRHVEASEPLDSAPLDQAPNTPEKHTEAPARDGAGILGPAALYSAAMRINRALMTGAAYHISPDARSQGKVQQLADGEEIGESRGPWHEFVGLPPTFSTWSQVMMLQLYLVVVRARALSPETFTIFHKQLLEHFFLECETIMQVNHEITSRVIRAPHLKDLFIQWRGLVAAYDEGLVRGDAVLAAAIWRNLFKGTEDVDVLKLGAVVSWMRRSLSRLDKTPDTVFVVRHGSDLLSPLSDDFSTLEDDSEMIAESGP